ncbi:hypothetical protein A2U01_0069598, partial [Trifolium medium]|nr:hypothetical protein [Trifolium medium]
MFNWCSAKLVPYFPFVLYILKLVLLHKPFRLWLTLRLPLKHQFRLLHKQHISPPTSHYYCINQIGQS